jgi:hypothetical protein
MIVGIHSRKSTSCDTKVEGVRAALEPGSPVTKGHIEKQTVSVASNSPEAGHIPERQLLQSCGQLCWKSGHVRRGRSFGAGRSPSSRLAKS